MIINVFIILYNYSRHTSRATPCILINIPDGHTKNMPAAQTTAPVEKVRKKIGNIVSVNF